MQKVNYILHHQAVSMKMAEDDLRHTHIALYNALFLIWNRSMFAEELSVNRNDVMQLSKIGNANTYTKLMKDLDAKGYIKYKPSFNPLKGSLVTIIRCDKGSDKGTDKGGSKGTDKGSGEGGDTLYKLLNIQTYKLIEANASLIEAKLEDWIKMEKGKPTKAEIDWDKFVQTFNKLTGKNTRSVSAAAKKNILARLKEGYTKEDLMNVIMVKTKEWKGEFTSDGQSKEKWLTYETLFRASKFGKYVNEAEEIKEDLAKAAEKEKKFKEMEELRKLMQG